MVAIWKAIREGANAYLKRQFRTIAIIAILIAVVIVAAFGATVNFTYGEEIAFSFLLGVAFSLFAAYIAMYSATNSNVRSTAAAEKRTFRKTIRGTQPRSPTTSGITWETRRGEELTCSSLLQLRTWEA